MAFKAAFIAHAPDAEAEKQSCVVKTPKYNLFVRVVRDQGQAVEVSRKLATEEGIHSILLCPGFTHKKRCRDKGSSWRTDWGFRS